MKIQQLVIKQYQSDFYSVELKYDGIDVRFEEEAINLSFLKMVQDLNSYIARKLTENKKS